MSLNSTLSVVDTSTVASVLHTDDDSNIVSTIIGDLTSLADDMDTASISTKAGLALLNTSTTGKFYWNITIQTVTPPTTIVVGTDYYYYYIYWFYSCLTLLFLLCMSALIAKMAKNRRDATAAQVAARTARQNAAGTPYIATTNTASTTTPPPPPFVMANNNNDLLTDVIDLPPSYDDAIQIVNAKLELRAAEEGAVGTMASAISTTTMETNLDSVTGSATDINASQAPTMAQAYSYQSSANQ